MRNRRLIVGLGNPGKSYASTRHNIGFQVVDAFASKQEFTFRSSLRARGKLAKGTVGDTDVILLKPTTYMNRSGIAVKACVKRFGLDSSSVLVVSDDVALPFGVLRLRAKGSSGGQKGLQNIEEMLGSDHYARLRVGIGDAENEGLADYVLGQFSPEEQVKLPQIILGAVQALTWWIEEGINGAIQKGKAASVLS